MITIKDVMSIANNLDITLTLNQCKEVIDMYPFEQELDPTGTWDLVVENTICNLFNSYI